jgi:glutamate racemase
VRLIDSAQQVAQEVRQVLIQEGLVSKNKKRPTREFFVSDEVAIFANVASRFLGEKLGKVKRAQHV